MITVVKSEWHQVEKRYSYKFDEELLQEIYPDDSEEEIKDKLDMLESGDLDIDEVVQDARDEGVDMDWEWMDEDDWWTDRKGGYEVTYEVIDD
jgi:hypothetical protein